MDKLITALQDVTDEAVSSFDVNRELINSVHQPCEENIAGNSFFSSCQDMCGISDSQLFCDPLRHFSDFQWTPHFYDCFSDSTGSFCYEDIDFLSEDIEHPPPPQTSDKSTMTEIYNKHTTIQSYKSLNISRSCKVKTCRKSVTDFPNLMSENNTSSTCFIDSNMSLPQDRETDMKATHLSVSSAKNATVPVTHFISPAGEYFVGSENMQDNLDTNTSENLFECFFGCPDLQQEMQMGNNFNVTPMNGTGGKDFTSEVLQQSINSCCVSSDEMQNDTITGSMKYGVNSYSTDITYNNNFDSADCFLRKKPEIYVMKGAVCKQDPEERIGSLLNETSMPTHSSQKTTHTGYRMHRNNNKYNLVPRDRIVGMHSNTEMEAGSLSNIQEQSVQLNSKNKKITREKTIHLASNISSSAKMVGHYKNCDLTNNAPYGLGQGNAASGFSRYSLTKEEERHVADILIKRENVCMHTGNKSGFPQKFSGLQFEDGTEGVLPRVAESNIVFSKREEPAAIASVQPRYSGVGLHNTVCGSDNFCVNIPFYSCAAAGDDILPKISSQLGMIFSDSVGDAASSSLGTDFSMNQERFENNNDQSFNKGKPRISKGSRTSENALEVNVRTLFPTGIQQAVAGKNTFLTVRSPYLLSSGLQTPEVVSDAQIGQTPADQESSASTLCASKHFSKTPFVQKKTVPSVRVGKKGRFVSLPVWKINKLMVKDLLSLSGNTQELSMKEKTLEYRRDRYKILEQKKKRLRH